MTGPSLIDFAEIAEIIARAADRPVVIRPMSSPQFLAMLEGAGVPSNYAAMLLRDQEAIRDGAAETISDTVQSLVGRRARSLVEYAADAADAWR